MAFKPMRQRRYEMLKRCGFLPIEAYQLSQVPVKPVPWMRELVRERKAQYRWAQTQNWTGRDWRNSIRDEYDGAGWLVEGRLSRSAVRRMYDEAEHRYKEKHPGYESPWEKKRKRKDYVGPKGYA